MKSSYKSRNEVIFQQGVRLDCFMDRNRRGETKKLSKLMMKNAEKRNGRSWRERTREMNKPVRPIRDDVGHDDECRI
jgi:hypothetical protein